MSDYSKSYNGAAKDAAESVVSGADFDTEFTSIATAITSKANKKVPAAVGNVASLSSTGDLTDTGVTSTEVAILDGATVTTTELNLLDGVTSTTAELNILDGVTSTTAELNILDGVTATTAEINYVDGVTSDIQTQLGTKLETVSSSDVGTATAGLATGSIGTYAMLTDSGTATVIPGGTLPYTSLYYTNAGGITAASQPAAGTWRCMGHLTATETAVADRVSLWLRIS